LVHAEVHFDFYCFPSEPVHALGFSGQDAGVIKHSLVAEVSVVFCHSQLLHFVYLGVVVVYRDPGLDGSTSLSNVHFATLGDALYA
jgi:hypothetical protein